ncbi:8-oxoguanine deaminase [Alteromonas aestuariivivens]|uniref:8-oxoguanine deaminase n=1 Tax=Alteromonas aestuariivivens TaxID=1938339 RepID=A0A3D8M7C3_9ALTE|nr:8-oxoguanine deaminase [Alteromonas aestuariivivens]RDV25523.1 8-oxoguanine deaminase [Alteromonas aestuariivivens]
MQRDSQTLWLRNPRAAFTANLQDASNGLLVRGSEIIELVGKGHEPVHPYQQELDCSNWVITPGLINTHHHFYQTLTRCLPAALNKPLFPWLTTLYKVWQHLDDEMLYNASRLAGLELMLSGGTTLADHHYVFPKGLEHGIDIQVEAMQRLGCRAVLTRGSMSLGESQGGLPPDSVIQSESQILADSQRLIKRYHNAQPGSYLQIALAPCSPFSVSRELMQQTATLAAQEKVLLHTHLAETEDENQFCLREYGMRPLDYLEDCGWLGPSTWLAHGIHFTDEEILRLGRNRVGIAHCPSSNGLLASGICPTLDLEQAGCAVGMAVDGSASNDCSNLIQEVRQSLLQQRLRYGAQRITAEKVLSWATLGSAKVLHRDDIGELAVGKQADLAFFALDELRFSGAGDPIAALVLCGAQKVEKLMIGGNWLIEDAQHRAGLEQVLMARHSELAVRLQSRLAQ